MAPCALAAYLPEIQRCFSREAALGDAPCPLRLELYRAFADAGAAARS